MKISIADAIQRTVEHREVFHDEMLHVMRQIMGGELTQAQIAGFVIGLRVKKETVGEIAAAAQVMREFATRVAVVDDAGLVDTCGTGGDSAHTFNISTASAIVAAAAGAKVAKHMGRSVSSSSGSADVLEAIGAVIALSPQAVARAIEEIGLGFMFAPSHHAAMKYAAPVRKELGVRTIFNLLGPLTNPAGARNQVMGVFHPDLVGIQVRVLQRLGSRHVMVVHGRDGLDEISISGETLVGVTARVLGVLPEVVQRCAAPNDRGDSVARVEDGEQLGARGLELRLGLQDFQRLGVLCAHPVERGGALHVLEPGVRVGG